MALRCFLFPIDGSQVDEDGNPFPITGLRVQMTPFYEEAVRDGTHVRRDPSAVTALTQPAVYSPVDIGITLEQAIATAGSRVGERRETTGWAELEGEHPFDVEWTDDTSTPVNDCDVFAVFPGAGSWVLVEYTPLFNVKKTRLFGDGVRYDRAALENIIAERCKQHRDLDLPPGTYRLDGTGPFTIDYQNSEIGAWRWRMSAPGGGVSGGAHATLLFDGAGISASSAFLLATREVSFRGICFRSNVDCQAVIDWSNAVGDPNPGALTELGFDHSVIEPSASAVAEFGIVTGLNFVSHANLDYLALRNCIVRSCRQAQIRIPQGTSQAYGWQIRDCIIGNNRGTPSGPLGEPAPTSRGIWVVNVPVQVYNTAFARLSAVVHVEGSADVLLQDCDVEHVKRYVYVDNGQNNGGRVRIVGPRNGDSFPGSIGGVSDLAGTYPTIAAENRSFIKAGGASGSIVLNGTKFSSQTAAGGRDDEWKIEVALGVSVDATGCWFPNKSPILRDATPYSVEGTGGTRLRGCKSYKPVGVAWEGGGGESLSWEPIPDRDGSESSKKHVIFDADTAEMDIVFDSPEATTPSLVYEATAETGSPASLAVTISNDDRYGFTATLGAAPGMGASVRLTYEARIATLVHDVPLQEHTFTGVTRQTALSAGAAGSAAGCWWSWIDTCQTPTFAGPDDAVMWSHRSSTVNGIVMLMSFTGSLYMVINGNLMSCSSAAATRKSKVRTVVYDGANVLFYENGALTNSSAKAFTAAVGGRTMIGADGAGFYTKNLIGHSMHSFASGHGVPSAAEVLAHANAVIAGKDMQLMGTGGTATNIHGWRLNGDATAVDTVGSDDITTGAGTLLTRRSDLDFGT